MKQTLALTYLLFGIGFLGISLGQPLGIPQLPLTFFLKDHFNLSAGSVAGIAAIISIPFYLKPLAGMLADTVFFRITQRRQLIITSLAVAALWPFLIFLQSSLLTLTISLFLLVCVIVYVNTVFGGLFIKYGQGNDVTGQMNSARITAEGLGVAIAGLIGGALATKSLGYSYLLGSLCFLGVALVGYALQVENDQVQVRLNPRSQLRKLGKAHDLWLIVFILFLILVAPGIRTTLLYFQTDILHFSKAFIGQLTFINGGSALVGAGLYGYICQRVPVGKLLWFGVVLYLATTLSYLDYRGAASAIVIQAANGFALAFAALPVLDIATRSCPKGLEATSYGVILSITNITLAFSDILGATLYGHYQISFYSLVWINLATTLIAVPFVFRLPTRLMEPQT